MTADPLALLAALADDARLRAFAELLLHGGTTASVAVVCGTSDKDALRLLVRLESVGLVRRDGDGWAARSEALREAVVSASERPPVDHGASDTDRAAVLRAFLRDGRLEQVPASRGKRLVVLDHVATVFEPGTRYAEQDVNTLLSAIYADYASLRRYLVDEGFLSRESGTYWRTGGTVDV